MDIKRNKGNILPLAHEGYFSLRRMEELQYEIREKQRKLLKRMETFKDLLDLSVSEIPIVKKPDNESQVALLFATIIANEKYKHLIKGINKIGHYSHQDTTDMICIHYDGNIVLVEIEYKLSN